MDKTEQRPKDIPSIGGQSLAQLEDIVVALGEPRFRARQLYDWVYRQGIGDYRRMSNLPASLKAVLSDYPLLPLETETIRQSADGTVKFLFRLHDGEYIETVKIPEGNRVTVCVSTQVGCAMGCTFCATGQGGFSRNLTSSEIVAQVLAVWHHGETRVTNVVFMGMGEPLLNYDNVLAAIALLNDEQGLAIGMRHITISTCGIVPGIRRLADEELQLVLAISLHATTDEERQRIMPIAKRYSLSELLRACKYYVEKTGRRVSFEYALIQGVNDGKDNAQQLAKLLRDVLCHVNLIPVNPVTGTGLSRSDEKSVAAFSRWLEAEGVSVTVRRERGTDIEAACGQLKRSVRGESGPRPMGVEWDGSLH